MPAHSKKGFTLIELLIVISIIAILSAIGLVTFSSVLKGSRDAKRQSDLKFIQSALEQYYNDKTYYPTALSELVSGSKVYLTQIPIDPKPPPDYSYVPSASPPAVCDNSAKKCTTYCLYAHIEGNPLTSDPGCTTPPAGFTYGVTRP